ncbi:MAG: glycosyltransferase [Gammaproteobacteria bacterium]|nr:glycosyltransferase [Gammaproteobacteria bacterium]
MISSADLPGAAPRISFGIIVLNGEPFLRYCLRQLYPHAHEILVVEGGSRKAASFAPDGHSTDGTLETLAAFKRDEDPEGKLKVITREGFWSEKDEQSQAYAQAATGDWLWQVDVDEFYTHADLEKVKAFLHDNPDVTAVSFRQIPFFGSPRYAFDSYNLRAENTSQYHRLFRWAPGYAYATHRPPTVVDEHGTDLRRKRWVSARETERMGVYLYHYSLLLPKQVRDKCAYYNDPGDDPTKAHAPEIVRWAHECYFRLGHPFRVHNVYSTVSWLRRHGGTTPEQVTAMWSDIAAGRVAVDTRRTDDIEALLARPGYRLAGRLLTLWSNLFRLPGFRFVSRALFWLMRRLRRVPGRTARSENVAQ